MNEFIKKVRAAAVAGWWTLLIFYCVLMIQWFAYLLITAQEPAGISLIWGKSITWLEIRTIWLWVMVAFKLGLAMMLFVVIWLTLWVKQLAKK